MLAARNCNIAFLNATNPAEERINVFGNSSTKISLLSDPLIPPFPAEATGGGGGGGVAPSDSTSSCPNFPPRPRNSSNCTAADWYP